jgi:hypothetical protein
MYVTKREFMWHMLIILLQVTAYCRCLMDKISRALHLAINGIQNKTTAEPKSLNIRSTYNHTHDYVAYNYTDPFSYTQPDISYEQ